MGETGELVDFMALEKVHHGSRMGRLLAHTSSLFGQRHVELDRTHLKIVKPSPRQRYFPSRVFVEILEPGLRRSWWLNTEDFSATSGHSNLPEPGETTH
jgi:hypothetical protein